MLRRWVAFAVVLCAVVLMIPRPARADNSSAHSVAVAVLALDSDDAEEQAEALTGALRSKIRTSQGWSLIETTQTLGMLTAALRCPGKPVPAECEQRIAEQLKTDRFIYGYVTKGPQAGQVTAEVHLFQKSKPDAIIRESFSDNLKDANDDTLRTRAQKIIERLGGSAVGSIVVKMGTENGEIIIDGEKRVPMTNGTAHVDLSPGSHSVEASTKSGDNRKRNINVVAGKETVVDLALAGTSSGPTEPAKEEKPFPVKKVIGGSLMAAGVAGIVVGVVFFSKYNSDNDAGTAANQTLHDHPNPQQPELPAGKQAGDVCGTGFFQNGSHPVCIAQEDAKTHSTIGWITGGIGAAALLGGAYLVFFTSDSKPSEPKSGLQKLRVNPLLGVTNGVGLSGAF